MSAERGAVKELEKDGWLVYRVKGSTPFNRNVYLFNLFDIFCIKNVGYVNAGRSNRVLIFRKYIQVKHQKPPLREFIEFKKNYCSPRDDVEIWIKERGRFEKIKINNEFMNNWDKKEEKEVR